LLFCLLCGIAHASGEKQFGIDFQGGIPQEEFAEEMKQGTFGIGFWGGYRFNNTPILVGIDTRFSGYGRENRKVPLSTTIPDIRVNVTNYYNFFNGNLLLRIMPQSEIRFRPYVEGLFGFNYLHTTTVMRESISKDDNTSLRDKNYEDYTLAYGAGAGLHVRLIKHNYGGYTGLHEENQDRKQKEVTVYANLSSRYMFGGEAGYLQKGSINHINGEVEYDVYTSRTDLL
jgi:hypothetical protein